MNTLQLASLLCHGCADLKVPSVNTCAIPSIACVSANCVQMCELYVNDVRTVGLTCFIVGVP